MTDFYEIMEHYIGWQQRDVAALNEWLASDIVRLIQLLDAELQRRAYAAGEYDTPPCCGEEWDEFEDLDND